MRHNRGCRRNYSRNNSNLNPVGQQNNVNRQGNLINQRLNILKPQGATYIGRCRCGYGPNAFYKTPNGNIVHANQLNQPILPKKNIQNNRVPINTTPEPSSKIQLYRICNRCGARVRDEADYCTECGNELGEFTYTSKKEQIEDLKNQIRELKTQIKRLKKL